VSGAVKPFDTERIGELILRAQQGDNAAKEQLISEHMGLVYRIAARFVGRGTDIEDLHQLGAMGLLAAIENFDCSKGTRFSTYAVPVITGEIKRHFRDHGAIKVSRSLKAIAGHAARVTEEFQARCGRTPTISELARELKVSKEELVQAVEANAPVRSFSEPLGDDNATLAETIPAPDTAPLLLERLDIASAISKLSDREQIILHLRFDDEKSQSYIAKKLGISQVQVSRLEKKILLALKNQLK